MLSLLVFVLVATMIVPPARADTSPPTGTILRPLPGSWTDSGSLYLYVRFMDLDRISPSSFSIKVDGVSLPPDWITANWTDVVIDAYVTDLMDGPHSAEASASDELGNGPTVLAWSFSIDTVDPIANITYPVGNPVLVDGSVTLAWTGSDAASGIDHYMVRLDDGSYFGVGKATTFPFHDLAPGVHYFEVVAYDVAGNDNYYASPVAVATVPAPPVSPTTQVTVVVPAEIPAWAIVLVVINAVEAVIVVALALRPRRPPPGSGKPSP